MSFQITLVTDILFVGLTKEMPTMHRQQYIFITVEDLFLNTLIAYKPSALTLNYGNKILSKLMISDTGSGLPQTDITSTYQKQGNHPDFCYV